MLAVIQRFGKHCSCHFQGKCVEVGRFWEPRIEQADSLATATFAGTFGKLSTFDAAHPRKPKLHIELQPRKRKDKNYTKTYLNSSRVNVRTRIIQKPI
jgi:hypothetical protein